MMGDPHDRTDVEWNNLQQALGAGQRGREQRQDRREMNGIFLVLRNGTRWRDPPETYGPYNICCNRFNHWRKAGGGRPAVLERLQSIMNSEDDQDGDGARSHRSWRSALLQWLPGPWRCGGGCLIGNRSGAPREGHVGSLAAGSA